MMNKILLFSLTLVLFGCGFIIKKQIIENYYLTAPDTEDQLSLSYHEPADEDNYDVIVDAKVFAIGYNEKYIIAKQHPRIFPNPPDITITNYYILPLKKGMNWRSKNGLMGPLTLQQFNDKRVKLNITNISFKTELEFSK